MTARDTPRHSTADFDPLTGPRADLARAIPRRPRVRSWMVAAIAVVFAMLVMPTIMVDRWLGVHVEAGQRAPITVRVPPFAGYQTRHGHIDGGVLVSRGEVATRDDAQAAADIADAMPHGPAPYLAYFLVVAVLAGVYSHHLRRSTRGRLVRVQGISLVAIAITAVAVKLAMLATAISVLAVPVAVFAIVPTLVLDRVVGLATGTLAALVIAMVSPFDVGVAILLLVQVCTAGLVVAERPKGRVRAALLGGGLATLLTGLTYPLMVYLTTGHLPLAELRDPMHSAWLAAAIGPALATVIAVPAIPLYQLFVGEISAGKLIALEDLSHPMLKQIAERSPGTWQHSLAMANMAELAANAIGANGRLVRVGAYFHDLGKSLEPKYFIENLEPGETSPHDQLPPEVSCDAIFKHVTEGIVTARRAGIPERIIDFMHMHHGNGVLEYFWAKCREQGNPSGLTIDHFRYPGVPPQSRETAILAICDAVEAASRTLKKPEPAAIDTLVQRIIYGKLHLGQLDDSGLSMADLRRMADSLKDTIRHANHGRIEYPWQKAQQDASASVSAEPLTGTGPRLDSLDRPAKPEAVRPAAPQAGGSGDALATTADASGKTTKSGDTPSFKRPAQVVEPEPVMPAAATRTGQRRSVPGNDAAALADARAGEVEISKARRDVQNEVARVLGDDDAARSIAPSSSVSDPSPSRAQAWHAEDAGISRPGPTLPVAADRSKRASRSPEVAAFAADAQNALAEASRDRAALPRVHEQPAQPPRVEQPAPPRDAAEPRKRAATLPPMKPPTMPPPILGRRAPTIPPSPGMMLMKPMLPPTTVAGHAPAPLEPAPTEREHPAVVAARARESSPPTPARSSRPTPTEADRLVPTVPMMPVTRLEPTVRRSPTTPASTLTGRGDGPIPAPIVHRQPTGPAPRPRMAADDDASRTSPRVNRLPYDTDPDDTQPRLELPLPAPQSNPVIALPGTDPQKAWVRGLAERIDAAIDDDFGGETPVIAPTRAELQALLGTPLDATRVQSIEEVEVLQRRARDRRDPHELQTRRAPYPTAEVDDADIEAAIELAPPARKPSASIGVAKKKPTE